MPGFEEFQLLRPTAGEAATSSTPAGRARRRSRTGCRARRSARATPRPSRRRPAGGAGAELLGFDVVQHVRGEGRATSPAHTARADVDLGGVGLDAHARAIGRRRSRCHRATRATGRSKENDSVAHATRMSGCGRWVPVPTAAMPATARADIDALTSMTSSQPSFGWAAGPRPTRRSGRRSSPRRSVPATNRVGRAAERHVGDGGERGRRRTPPSRRSATVSWPPRRRCTERAMQVAAPGQHRWVAGTADGSASRRRCRRRPDRRSLSVSPHGSPRLTVTPGHRGAVGDDPPMREIGDLARGGGSAGSGRRRRPGGRGR